MYVQAKAPHHFFAGANSARTGNRRTNGRTRPSRHPPPAPATDTSPFDRMFPGHTGGQEQPLRPGQAPVPTQPSARPSPPPQVPLRPVDIDGPRSPINMPDIPTRTPPPMPPGMQQRSNVRPQDPSTWPQGGIPVNKENPGAPSVHLSDRPPYYEQRYSPPDPLARPGVGLRGQSIRPETEHLARDRKEEEDLGEPPLGGPESKRDDWGV